MEKPKSQFGLLNDVINEVRRAEKNVNLAASNVHAVLTALEAGEVADRDVLIFALKEAQAALRAVAF